MKQTEQCGLNQWELSDRVRMEDFNADNAKIEGLFGCHPSGELLGTVTLTEDSTSMELDLTEVDWSRYLTLILEVTSSKYDDIIVGVPNAAERSVVIGQDGVAPKLTDGLVIFSDATHIMTFIPVLYSGDHGILALSFGLCDEGTYQNSRSYGLLAGGGGRKNLNQCPSLLLTRNHRLFYAGDHCALWGVK